MKVENKIYQLIKTANTGMDILNDADTKEIYPLCINEITSESGVGRRGFMEYLSSANSVLRTY